MNTNNFYNLTLTEFSAAMIVLNIVFVLILQLGIAWVYKKTHRGISYSPSFIFTLIIIGILGAVVMMIVQNNFVGAITLLGAFSLIRFRTILKETRDIAFLFFSLVAGVAVGTGNYSIALISVTLISLIILVLDWYKVGSILGRIGFVLTFNAKNDLDVGFVNAVLKKYSDSFGLLQINTHGVGVDAYVFSVNLRKDVNAAEVVKDIKNSPSIMDVEFITTERSVEY